MKCSCGKQIHVVGYIEDNDGYGYGCTKALVYRCPVCEVNTVPLNGGVHISTDKIQPIHSSGSKKIHEKLVAKSRALIPATGWPVSHNGFKYEKF